MNNGNIEEFDGISLIVWTENNKIMELKEFGCNLNTYNPYAQNDMVRSLPLWILYHFTLLNTTIILQKFYTSCSKSEKIFRALPQFPAGT